MKGGGGGYLLSRRETVILSRRTLFQEISLFFRVLQSTSPDIPFRQSDAFLILHTSLVARTA